MEELVAEIGLRPAGKTLDRINSNGHYETGNVRWVNPTEQAQNRRPSFSYHNWHRDREARDEYLIAARHWRLSVKAVNNHADLTPEEVAFLDDRHDHTGLPRATFWGACGAPHYLALPALTPKTLSTPWRETSVTNEFIKITRDELGYRTVDPKGKLRFYSPHGLRHLCGVELAHAGASDRQIASVLGHATLKQVQVYVKQAEQRVLARDAQRKRDEMYEREVFEAAIEAAGNITRLRST